MSEPVRWIVAAVAAVLLGCLLVLARGDDHHRGDEVGALAPPGWPSARVAEP